MDEQKSKTLDQEVDEVLEGAEQNAKPIFEEEVDALGKADGSRASKQVLKEVSVSKEFKVGLPQFSNITVGVGLKFDIADGEWPYWDAIWDMVNQQLAVQTQGIDPSWIEKGEFKNFFKVTIRVPKGGE